ncbi:PfkB family carbohydrate kinase [Pedobacter sp. AW31-3R]|uniref:PfkB family carbohydrate kinase n=1 Tax=Pedobacter sp. AW31-3R TaxID=3445781 RepID=UPI003FA160F9
MYDICCIGHLTLDKVVTPYTSIHMAGGTSFYFSNAIRNMDTKYCLVTAVAETEIASVEALREKGITVEVLPSAHTVYFENIYGHNLDNRTQRVLQTADSFSVEDLKSIPAKIFHLGPLLAKDIPVELIQYLSLKGRVSLDVQGYLREVKDTNVLAIDWKEKKEGLQYVDILKANEHEMEVLTGSADIQESAYILHEWGVKEVVITLGSKGAVIYDGTTFYTIRAYRPKAETDATGCGDTYMAGYLYQRSKGKGIQESGEFAAAMASLKIESSGPFTGTEEDVEVKLAQSIFN